MNIKYFIGPMSKNIVDTIINYSNENNISIGLIPSRRQIDFNSGYVNNWKTKNFITYVRKKTNNIIIERDHGGILQGATIDDGIISLKTDAALGFDLIHVDPWKKYTNIFDAAEETSNNIKLCYKINPHCKYEIGTEESIQHYSRFDLEKFLIILRNKLGNLFKKIEYIVIQCGTKLEGNQNIAIFDEQRCRDMIKIGQEYGIKTKEHNGDYVSIDILKKKFELGIDAINIAPEFGTIESTCLLNYLEKNNLNNFIEQIYELCLFSNKWQKWFPANFQPHKEKHKLITVSGHYIYSTPEFKKIKSQLDYDILNKEICKQIKNKLEQLHSI